MDDSSQQGDRMAGENQEHGSGNKALADAPHIEKELSNKVVFYSSIVAFLAWVFSVYDYTLFGTLLPVMAEGLGWSTATSTAVATYVGVGVFIVSVGVGPMLDYFGRKASLIMTTAGAALSSGLTALSFSALYVVVIRAFSGLGYSEQVVNAAYLNEIYGKQRREGFVYRRRGLIYSLVQGGWPVGVLVGAAMAAVLVPTVGWRGTFVVATLPAIIIVVMGFWLKESPTFKAMQYVKKLEKEGRHDEAVEFGREHDIDTSRSTQNTFRQIFGADIRKHTIFLSLAFLANWVGIQVFAVLGTTVLTEGKGFSFSSALLVLIISNAAAFIGYLTHGYFGDLIGRRWTIAGGWLISGTAYTIMLFGPDAGAFVLTMYTIGLFFVIGPYAALLFYMGESFPTRMRGTGAAFVNAMGPLGAIVGSALLTVFLSAGFQMTTSAFFAGAVAIVLSGLLMFGTRKVADVDEAEAVGAGV
ncbi:MFS transporter [soil metagenome]|jgi:MFS family permease